MAKILILDKLVDKLTDYIKVKGEQLKLEIMGHVARILAHVIVFIFVAMIGLFFGLFLMFTLAVVLNYFLESAYLGYVIVTGFLLVLLIIVISLLRSGKAQRWFETMILKISEND